MSATRIASRLTSPAAGRGGCDGHWPTPLRPGHSRELELLVLHRQLEDQTMSKLAKIYAFTAVFFFIACAAALISGAIWLRNGHLDVRSWAGAVFCGAMGVYSWTRSLKERRKAAAQ